MHPLHHLELMLLFCSNHNSCQCNQLAVINTLPLQAKRQLLFEDETPPQRLQPPLFCHLKGVAFHFKKYQFFHLLKRGTYKTNGLFVLIHSSESVAAANPLTESKSLDRGPSTILETHGTPSKHHRPSELDQD
jgi:hypothetical protein